MGVLAACLLGLAVAPAAASACEAFKQVGSSVLNLTAIYEYACKYAISDNPEYFAYNDDSANFTSQLLLAGGVEARKSYVNSPLSWFTFPPAKGSNLAPAHSESWMAVPELYKFLLLTGLAEELTGSEAALANTKTGDLIFWDWAPVAGAYNDVGVVVSGGGAEPMGEIVASHGQTASSPGAGGSPKIEAIPEFVSMYTLLHSDLGPYLHSLSAFQKWKYGGSSECPESDPGSGGASGQCWNWRVLRIKQTTSQVEGPILPGETTGGWKVSEAPCRACAGDPVDTATGEFDEEESDLTVPGRGPGLALTRTYASGMAGTAGRFGYGWTDSYNMSLVQDPESAEIMELHQENGSIARFAKQPDGTWKPASRVFATLVHNEDGSWTFTRGKTAIFTFNSSGQLISESDLNGDTETLAYNKAGQLTTVTDPAGRALTFVYSGADVSQVKDSAGRKVGYEYDGSGNLAKLTDVTGAVTKFGYDGSHRMTSLTRPNGGMTSNGYDESGRVTSQTDPLGHTTTWAYSYETPGTGSTTITDPEGIVTRDVYEGGDLLSATNAYGTSLAAATSYTYDPTTNEQVAVTDPENHTTTSTYDTDGNRLTQTDPLGNETTWKYNGYDEVASMTPPAKYGGQTATTTYTYDQPEYSSGGAGNLTTVSTPVLSSTGEKQGTQETHYQHANKSHPGDVTTKIDPRGNTWTYTYDSYGDKLSETAPATSDNSDGSGSRQNITRWAYETTTGWVTAQLGGRYTLAHPSETTCTPPATGCTTYTHDNAGRVLVSTDGNGHASTKHYDGDGNLEYALDANKNKTTYSYNLADQLVSTVRPDKSQLKTSYWPDGMVKDQVDASGADTHYAYDALGHLSATTDPDGHTTGYQYDTLGQLLVKADPGVSGCTPTSSVDGCTTYEDDADGHQTAVHYNDSNTHDVSAGYDADGRRTSMSDASGSSSWSYDSLGRIAQTTNGAGAATSYVYDLAGHVTSITYPGSIGTVTRAYDPAGRMSSITDWKKNTTNFTYDAEGNLGGDSEPTTGTSVADAYSYDAAGAPSQIKTAQGSSSLMTISYKRDNANQVAQSTGTGAAVESNTYTYNSLEQLASVNGTNYAYDPSNRLTGQPSGAKQTYDPAGELITTANGSAGVNFTYDAKGERRSAMSNTANIAPGYGYGYDQAGQLASIARSPAPGPHAMLSEGGNVTFLVRDDGTVTAAGANVDGQLGDGTTIDRHSPVSVLGLNSVRTLSSGPRTLTAPASDTLAVTASGQLWAWGQNENGELGDGSTSQRSTPELIGGLANVAQVSEGSSFSLAAKSDGTAWAWGANASGQLGLGSTDRPACPTADQRSRQRDRDSGGQCQLGGVVADGTVWTWGSDSHGQLGDGQTKTETSPHQVSGLSGITQIALGNQFVLALKSDGTLYAWGANNNGKLGDGTIVDEHSPEQVTALAGVQIVQIAAGQGFSAAVAQNGTLYEWGSNSNGQLGNEGAGSLLPEQVAGVGNVTQISAGSAVMAAVVDGVPEVWGANTDGQLGDGTTTDQHAPEQADTFNLGTRTAFSEGANAHPGARRRQRDGCRRQRQRSAGRWRHDRSSRARCAPTAAEHPRRCGRAEWNPLAVTTGGQLVGNGSKPQRRSRRRRRPRRTTHRRW